MRGHLPLSSICQDKTTIIPHAKKHHISGELFMVVSNGEPAQRRSQLTGRALIRAVPSTAQRRSVASPSKLVISNSPTKVILKRMKGQVTYSNVGHLIGIFFVWCWAGDGVLAFHQSLDVVMLCILHEHLRAVLPLSHFHGTQLAHI